MAVAGSSLKGATGPSTIGQRLKDAREKLGKSQRDMADAAGIPFDTYTKYEGDARTPGGEALAGLSALGINVNWLLTGEGPELLGATREGLPSFGDTIDFFFVPRYSVEASAGSGRVVEEESEIGRLAFRKDWIRQRGLTARDLVVVRVTGDSMEPTIRHDSLALVDSTQNKPRTDGIYVMMLDDHLVAKRLQVDFSGGVYIRSDNPAYREQHVSGEQLERLIIVGRVVWVGSEV